MAKQSIMSIPVTESVNSHLKGIRAKTWKSEAASCVWKEGKSTAFAHLMQSIFLERIFRLL